MAEPAQSIPERLEELRTEIRAERISQGELLELQGLAEHIDPGDVELLEWAGVPEFPEESQLYRVVGSFYVEAESAEAAERLVAREINGKVAQNYIGDSVGEIDVHEGEAEPWDLNG